MNPRPLPARMRPVPQPIAEMAHDLASFGAIILAVGGFALLLFAQATQ